MAAGGRSGAAELQNRGPTFVLMLMAAAAGGRADGVFLTPLWVFRRRIVAPRAAVALCRSANGVALWPAVAYKWTP
ncbi:unnamed protein product [Merluccius merluccius]